MHGVPEDDGPRPFQFPKATFLGGLSNETRDDLLGLGTLREFPAKTILMLAGAGDNTVMVLLDGTTKITGTGETGTRALLDIRIGGDIVGEMAGIDGDVRSATVTCVGTTLLRTVSYREFRAFLDSHQDADTAVQRLVVSTLRWANRRRVDFTGSRVRVRIARVLLELVRKYGHAEHDGLTLDKLITQHELAELVGAAEPSAERELRWLRNQRVIETSYYKISIVDLKRLQEIACAE